MTSKLMAVAIVLAVLVGAVIFLWVKPPNDPTVLKYPTTSADTGTDCGSTADSGIWSNRPGAFTDQEPDSDTTAASASGFLPDNLCDDWAGFGFSIPEGSTILEVLATVEFRVGSGTAFLNVGVFSGSTRCQPLGSTASPAMYTAVSFDFTSCKAPWAPADFNNAVLGVSLAAFPQVGQGNQAAKLYVDYVSITVTYNSPSGILGPPEESSRPASAPAVPAFLVPAVLASTVLLAAGALIFLTRKFPRVYGIVSFVAGIGVFLLFVLPYLSTINLGQ